MQIDHWMMFATFKEQRHFVYPEKSTYTGAIINANMAAHAPDGLGAFLIEKTAGLKYIIDPMTHAFQHDPSALKTRPLGGEPQLKSSIKSVAEFYGPPISSFVGERPLTPRDFSDPGIVDDFSERCVNFQESVLATAMRKNESIRYLPDLKDDQLKPHAVVAPYFYMSESSIEKWLPVNIKIAKRAVNLSSGRKVFASIVVTQGVILDDAYIQRLHSEYSKLQLDGYLLWIDDLNEHEGGGAELRGMLKLARKLRGASREREVINLHGGYFSVLAAAPLGGEAFSGVTHGPEFGEHRAVVPVGGGIPIARYYVPLLHARVRYRHSLEILRAKHWLDSAESFHRNVCNCDECIDTIAGDARNFTRFGESRIREVRRRNGIVRMEFPTAETQIHCLNHYLQRKRIEYTRASSDSSEHLLEDLRRGVSELEDAAGLEAVGHLRIWEKVLTS